MVSIYNNGKSDFAEWVMLAALAVILGYTLFSAFSNAGDGPEKTEVLVITDDATGLQYLGIRGVSMTPRLDADGNHVRSEVESN